MKNNLKKLRKDCHLSLQQLGDMCGRCKAHMHLLEKDKANPTLDTAYRVAAVLNLDVEDIWPNTLVVTEQQVTIRRIKDRDERVKT